MPANVDMNALNRRFPVPEGFRALLEALAREVLRGQPSDIYAFSALFFEKLLYMREEYDGVNPVKDPELYEKFKVQLFTEALKRHLVSPKLAITMGLDLDDAKLVQTHNDRRRKDDEIERGYDAEMRPVAGQQDENDEDIEAEARAATKIQAEIRGFLTRKQFEKIKQTRNSVQHEPLSFGEPVIKQSRSFDATVGDLDELELDDDTLNAATKIQAGVRGYLTRQRYNEMKKQQKHAASKIQAGIRGHLTRKHLEAQGVPVHRSSRGSSPAKIERKNSAPEQIQPSPSDVFDDNAAAKIQAGVRGYLTRKRLEERGVRVHAPRRQSLQPHHHYLMTPPCDMRQRSGTNPDEEAATKIQAGIRGYLTRKRLKDGGSGRNIAGLATGDEGNAISPGDVDDYEMEGRRSSDVAATKIQAGVRSYLTRVNIKKQKEAATKIQSAFRGHQVRRDIKTTNHGHGDGDDGENGWENVPSDGEA